KRTSLYIKGGDMMLTATFGYLSLSAFMVALLSKERADRLLAITVVCVALPIFLALFFFFTH
ncbi:hypothetical protein, partial [Alkalihalobacillus alcalophilus]|uniref:hypothetical protein n=1 Tax=Alkalihalobacillus alcalophilus TaxID=1445 RepID=UPI001B3B40BE